MVLLRCHHRADDNAEEAVGPAMAGVRVLIVDDNEDMRALVRLLLDLERVVEVVGEAASTAAAVATWRALRPDVIVLDYRMDDSTGLEAARQILDEDPGVAILLFSAFLSDENVAEAERLGVRACVSKDHLRQLTDLVVAFATPEAPPGT
jgi:DNA-binding NarL/FixJ family response regulator